MLLARLRKTFRLRQSAYDKSTADKKGYGVTRRRGRPESKGFKFHYEKNLATWSYLTYMNTLNIKPDFLF